jgi:methyltransferase (TIGR00027 family)
MAEIMAMRRFTESSRPEDERICYDPYAVRFIDPAILRSAAEHPEETKAKAAQIENLFPGLGSSICARVRYFDDFVTASVKSGIRQLVILGAGYDTRAYRIGSLKGTVRVFEVDHPDTQRIKMKKISEIFGSLPDHVTFIPVDFEQENFGQKLERSGYNHSKKTLFILEGLVMYIPPVAVDEILGYIIRNSVKGSRIIFDFYLESVVSGANKQEAAQNVRNFTRMAGEPLQFGMPDGEVVRFLADRNFTKIHNVTSVEYKKLYFTGKNVGRPVSDLLSFVTAEVP